MAFNLSAILALIVAFQLLFIAFFLLTNSGGKRVSNILLGVFFLLLGINVTDMLLQILQIQNFATLFFLIDDTFLLLFGPLMFLYTHSVVFKNFRLQEKQLIHFIPFTIFFLAALFLFYNKAIPLGTGPESFSNNNTHLISLLVALFFYLHGGYYLWRSKKLLYYYEQKIKDHHSNPGRIDIGWLHFINNSFLVLCVLGIIQILIPVTNPNPYLEITGFLFIIFLFFFINRSILKALKKVDVLSGLLLPSKEKYVGSAISDQKRKEIAEKLDAQMIKQQHYLDPDLGINDLAESLQISSKELSQVINQTFDQHFFDFVNSYRIKEAIKLLEDPSNDMTIQEIMYAVGFSSKSSFNTVFKKITRTTPSAFRAKVQVS